MKLLTIVAVIIGVVCMAMFYAGNAHAEVSFGQCMAACKLPASAENPDGRDCKGKTKHERAGCNNECWCQCSPDCVIEGGSLASRLAANPLCSTVTGKAIAAGAFNVCMSLTDFQTVNLEVTGDYPEQPQASISLNQGMFQIPMRGVSIFRDPDGCFFEEDLEPRVEVNLVGADDTLYDPADEAVMDLILAPTSEDAGQAFVESLYAVSLNRNSNACPYLNPDQCNCDKEPIIAPVDRCLRRLEMYPHWEEVDCSVCLPDSCMDTTWLPGGGYPSNGCSDYVPGGPPEGELCDPFLNTVNPGCCYRHISAEIVGYECTLPDLTVIACEDCSFEDHDDDDDYGEDACNIGDLTEIIDGVPTQTVFADDCVWYQMMGSSDNLNEWRQSVSAMIGTASTSIVKQMFDEGRVMDQNLVPYGYQEAVDCMADDFIRIIQENANP
jgi:hypothetical protein